MPLSSTRICPYFGLFATAIFSPVDAGLDDALEAGLDAPAEGPVPPHAAAISASSEIPYATALLVSMHADTGAGYAASAVGRQAWAGGRRPAAGGRPGDQSGGT